VIGGERHGGAIVVEYDAGVVAVGDKEFVWCGDGDDGIAVRSLKSHLQVKVWLLWLRQ